MEIVQRRIDEHQLARVQDAKRDKKSRALPKGYGRTTSLMAPIMQLTGHNDAIFAGQFSPNGKMLASAGMERLIYFWNVYDECDNYAVIKAHQGAIQQLQFSSDEAYLYSASIDKTVGIFDVETGTRIKRMKGHSSFVNSVCPARRGPPIVCSGSDDSTVNIWDSRKRGPTTTLQAMYHVTAVCFDDTTERVFSAGIDNIIKIWDLRRDAVVEEFVGHSDTVTGLELSPSGDFLLSNSMDNTLRIWDVRPFGPPNRNVKTMTGHTHTFEKNLLKCSWSPDNSLVACGSGDRFVYVFVASTGQLLYKLPGHNGSVNDVDFHPTEPILLSASSDKTIYLGELAASQQQQMR